jgi:hypothetical protein
MKIKCGAVFTRLHFLHNLQMDPISKSVCHWQAFPALCNVMLKLIVPICKLRKTWTFFYTVPGYSLTTKYGFSGLDGVYWFRRCLAPLPIIATLPSSRQKRKPIKDALTKVNTNPLFYCSSVKTLFYDHRTPNVRSAKNLRHFLASLPSWVFALLDS